MTRCAASSGLVEAEELSDSASPTPREAFQGERELHSARYKRKSLQGFPLLSPLSMSVPLMASKLCKESVLDPHLNY